MAPLFNPSAFYPWSLRSTPLFPLPPEDPPTDIFCRFLIIVWASSWSSTSSASVMSWLTSTVVEVEVTTNVVVVYAAAMFWLPSISNKIGLLPDFKVRAQC